MRKAAICIPVSCAKRILLDGVKELCCSEFSKTFPVVLKAPRVSELSGPLFWLFAISERNVGPEEGQVIALFAREDYSGDFPEALACISTIALEASSEDIRIGILLA